MKLIGGEIMEGEIENMYTLKLNETEAKELRTLLQWVEKEHKANMVDEIKQLLTLLIELME